MRRWVFQFAIIAHVSTCPVPGRWVNVLESFHNVTPVFFPQPFEGRVCYTGPSVDISNHARNGVALRVAWNGTGVGNAFGRRPFVGLHLLPRHDVIVTVFGANDPGLERGVLHVDHVFMLGVARPENPRRRRHLPGRHERRKLGRGEIVLCRPKAPDASGRGLWPIRQPERNGVEGIKSNEQIPLGALRLPVAKRRRHLALQNRGSEPLPKF